MIEIDRQIFPLSKRKKMKLVINIYKNHAETETETGRQTDRQRERGDFIPLTILIHHLTIIVNIFEQYGHI